MQVSKTALRIRKRFAKLNIHYTDYNKASKYWSAETKWNLSKETLSKNKLWENLVEQTSATFTGFIWFYLSEFTLRKTWFTQNCKQQESWPNKNHPHKLPIYWACSTPSII